MSAIEKLFSYPQYSIDTSTKLQLIVEELYLLTKFHHQRCHLYRNILDNFQINLYNKINSIEDIPFIPVRLFKTQNLKSIKDEEVLKVLTSSGTTGQQVSKISLDRETSLLQIKALASIITSYIGHQRLPMIIIDTETTIKNRTSLSARGAGLVGLSNFGRDHFFALNENMELKIDALKEFLIKHENEPILIFGFTFMVWQYFFLNLKEKRIQIDLSNGILIHSGGWKKLTELSVSNKIFKSNLLNQFGLKRIYNFYGMVEQVGSIYMECENGYLHTPNFAEILIRDFNDWSTLPIGDIGVIQTLSVLPKSYPGHSLLTEDIGRIIGVDDCPCGRKGTYFQVEGRVPKAELRGCSDTHADSMFNSKNMF